MTYYSNVTYVRIIWGEHELMCFDDMVFDTTCIMVLMKFPLSCYLCQHIVTKVKDFELNFAL